MKIKDIIFEKYNLYFKKIQDLKKKIFHKNNVESQLKTFFFDIESINNLIIKNCDKMINFLYEIEEKEKSISEIEIGFLVPIHDLIQEIIRYKKDISLNFNDLKKFLKENIKDNKNIDTIVNKKNTEIFIHTLKIKIFEINESFYKALKFDEITDILALNQNLVENITGLDKNNNIINSDKIFNQDETMISLYFFFKKKIDKFQKDISI